MSDAATFLLGFTGVFGAIAWWLVRVERRLNELEKLLEGP